MRRTFDRRPPRLSRALATALGIFAVSSIALAAEPAPSAENPLRAADEATQQKARTEAWETYQRSCGPCHGIIGAGDGPYANTSARPAADLRRASRDIIGDATRFTRIRDGAATLSERPWDSNMPAFGATLDANQIWGLVLLLGDLGERASGLSRSLSAADLYASRCAVCHGAKGAGDGPLASELFPAPTDLAHGPYRFRSTAFGKPPIQNDIMISTASGLSRTAMGGFLSLGGNHLESINAHVMSLVEQAAKPEETIPNTPAPGAPIAELVTKGRAVYAKGGCADCHGALGRGDGPKAAGLKDSAGRPSIATDLTQKWHYKRSGGGAPGVFQTLTTGLNGTPMVSYADTLTDEERWQIGYYLERLSRSQARFNPNVLTSVEKTEIPSDPAADFWQAIPATSVPLGPQLEHAPFWTQPSIDVVDVKVALRGDDLAILLAWNDGTRDVRTDDAGHIDSLKTALQRYGSWHLPDQIAVQFPETLDPKGTLPSAYAGTAARPVRRWLWSAARAESGDQKAVIDRVAGASAEPAIVTDAPPVTTTFTYADGQWRVLFRGKRPVKANALPMTVQAWDGSAGESGRWQSFSGWLNVALK